MKKNAYWRPQCHLYLRIPSSFGRPGKKAVREHLYVGDWDRVLHDLLPDLKWGVCVGNHAGLANHRLISRQIYPQSKFRKATVLLGSWLRLTIHKFRLQALMLVE